MRTLALLRLIPLLLCLSPLTAAAEDPVPPIPNADAPPPMVLGPAAPAVTAPATAAPAEAPLPVPLVAAAPLPTPAEVNAAEYSGGPLPEGLSALTLKLEILLDEVGMSPGVIDGVNGKNVAKAIAAVEVITGLPVDGVLDEAVWQRLPRDTPILVDYAITAEDVAGPFLKAVPTDYAEMAKLDQLSYTSPLEMFGERFHMDVDLLKALNPNVDFNAPGTHIVVAGANTYGVKTPVALLVADKANAQLRAYDADGKLVAAYPATIGSTELPSPSGTHTINAIARNAAYYYRPQVNFQQGNNTEKLTLPPGPNNPIGTTWIDLSEPTYGIHGTPEPSRIDKTNSHGCVRLTNWDVEELAGLVKKGVPVEFRD
jgi:lipoprotein-anchoring transpeptidase ErfK/SrfK